jgi:tetratricopeptide (TPR) repeat protein
MSNRIEALQAMLAQDNSNSFARYGLAMEYGKAGRLEDAIHEFRTVIAANPNYVAAYYHGGQMLERLGQLDEARTVYEQGIAAAVRTGDNHARSEIQAALDILPI